MKDNVLAESNMENKLYHVWLFVKLFSHVG